MEKSISSRKRGEHTKAVHIAYSVKQLRKPVAFEHSASQCLYFERDSFERVAKKKAHRTF